MGFRVGNEHCKLAVKNGLIQLIYYTIYLLLDCNFREYKIEFEIVSFNKNKYITIEEYRRF